MAPRQKVDLDLDALAPPPVTIRLRGRVYSLPGEIAIDTVVSALQLQEKLGNDDDEGNIAAINALLDIIHGLLAQENENYERVPLSLDQVMRILGLVLSGMDIDFEEAVKEAIAGADAGEEAEPTEEESDEHPPTASPKRASTTRSRSGARSPVAS